MRADVAVGERAENGVDQRMQRDVGVGMSGHAARMRNADAAEHDVIAVGEGVHVEAVADAHVGQRGAMRSFGAGEILVGRDLHVAGLAFEYADAMTGPFGERGVVGEILAPCRRRAAMRGEDQIEGESLRRLHDAQPVAVERFGDTRRIDRLDGVGDGDAGTAAPPAWPAAMARAIRAPVRNGRAASWMRTMSGALPRKRLEPGAHRNLPRRAAGTGGSSLSQPGGRGAITAPRRSDG